MCLILIAYRTLPDAPLVLAANRDEYYRRPSAPMHWWAETPGLLAGRDLQAGGAWLAVSEDGRLAAITNFTDPDAPVAPKSRGELPLRFLAGKQSASAFADQLRGADHAGFNLLLWDGRELVCASNRGSTRRLAPGCHGLTNTAFGTPWPKAVEGARDLGQSLQQSSDTQALITLLRQNPIKDRSGAPADPSDAAPEVHRRQRFLEGADYGTRASTAVIMGDGIIQVSEQNYGPGSSIGEERLFSFAPRR